jgi:hypothetical protein
MIDYCIAAPDTSLLPVTWSNSSRASREAAAEAWTAAAKRAGLSPCIVQQPLASDDAGEWHIKLQKRDHGLAGHPGPLPDELWDEAFRVLEAQGDIVHDAELKCWHGAVLLDDASQCALALRLRLACRSLGLSTESFFAPVQPKAPQTHVECDFSEEDLIRLCECHGIPEEWLTSGEAAEIELPVT